MIARTDDGHFDEKKLIVVEPDQQPKIYKSVESHVEITLPENPMRYTSCPSVDPKHGIWAATGINAANVGMTATETTTSNPRVLAADPMVELREAKDGEEERCGGIGEEDIVVLVLPYIRSAREGVLRLGALLEQYGTYESNGIAFNDENEDDFIRSVLSDLKKELHGNSSYIRYSLKEYGDTVAATNQLAGSKEMIYR